MQLGIGVGLGFGAGKVTGAGTPVTITTYAGDTFNRAVGNITPAGTTETGGYLYVKQSGDWAIDANGTAYLTAGNSGLSFNTTTISDNYAAEVKWTALCAAIQRFMFRLTDFNNYWYIGKTNTTQYVVAKRVAANTTTLFTLDQVPVAGDTIRAEVQGTNLVFKINGTTIYSTSDSFNQTAAGFGLFAGDTVGRFDDLKVTSL